MITDKERYTTETCDLCGQQITVDKLAVTNCEYCGWIQDFDALDFPDMVRYPNRIPFNKAKKLFEEGKRLVPSFEDFIGMFEFYSEVEFTYKNKRYGLCWIKGLIELFECDTIQQNFTSYLNIEDFREKANINGVPLKDIWEDVENPYWLQ